MQSKAHWEQVYTTRHTRAVHLIHATGLGDEVITDGRKQLFDGLCRKMQA